jgi:uncharacterized protein (DUF433 family)
MAVCNRRPVAAVTRIAVQTVLEFLAAGDSVEDVLEEYPSLSRADVQACLDYASRVMGNHFSVVQTA